MTHAGEENKKNQAQDKDEGGGGGRVQKEKEDKWKEGVKHRVRIVREKNRMNNNLFTYFCESGIVFGFLYQPTHIYIVFW